MSTYSSTPIARVTADLGQGVATVDATSWRVSRSISGPGVPGQVRATSGISAGSGSVDVDLPSAPTPWSGGIRPGGAVSVDIVPDIGEVATPLARMVCREVSALGALTTARTLGIEDDLTGLREAPVSTVGQLILSTYGETQDTDMSWVLDQAARAGGFYATPRLTPSAILSVPLCGSIAPEVGKVFSAGFLPTTWVTYDDEQVGMEDPVALEYEMTTPVYVSSTAYVTVTRVKDSVGLTFKADIFANSFTLGITETRLIIYRDGAADQVIPWVENAEKRFQIQIEPLSPTITRFRARTSPDPLAWSAWLVVTGSVIEDPARMSIVAGIAQGVQVTTQDEPSLWDAPSARIAAADAPLLAALIGSTRTAWDLLQEAAAATLGAVWVDERGRLIYQSRALLRGARAAPTSDEEIVSLVSLDDVPWSVSSDDTADRVEVRYTPPVIAYDSTLSGTFPHTVWEATEAIEVRAGATVTLDITLDGVSASGLSWQWLPIWSVAQPAGTRSRWAAAISPDGGGPQPADNALGITSTLLSPSRIQITITNRTTSTLWTVDGTGAPTLIVRAALVARSGEQITVSTGVPAETARNTLTHDAGAWIQDTATALDVLDWLTAQLADPHPILAGLGVTPRADRGIGWQVVLTDPLTGLRSRALVTGIDNSGSAGRWEQTLTLTLLETLVQGVDASLTGSTVAGVDTLITTALGATATVEQADAWLAARGVI